MSYDPMVANASPKELVRMVLADNDASERELRLANLIGDKFDAMAEEARIAESHAEQMEEEKEDAELRSEVLESLAEALKGLLEDALPLVESAGEDELSGKINAGLSRAEREL